MAQQVGSVSASFRLAFANMSLIILEEHLSTHCSSEINHGLIGVVLLDHLLVVLRMLQLNVLIQTSFRAIRFGAITNWTFVVSGYLCCSPTMSLLLFVVDFERHPEDVFVFSFIAL